jgi:hypothetical protein
LADEGRRSLPGGAGGRSPPDREGVWGNQARCIYGKGGKGEQKLSDCRSAPSINMGRCNLFGDPFSRSNLALWRKSSARRPGFSR